MANRLAVAALCLVSALGGQACSSEDAAEAIPRTGNPIARGFTEEDFPRVQQLAAGVYSTPSAP